MDKRASKPKTQYSPSEPSATTMYHLIVSSETGNLTIVGNSSVKRLSNDGFITLNDGRQGRLIISGTRNECIARWNKEIRPVIDENDDESEENEEEIPVEMNRTIQPPKNTFSTPGPSRRQQYAANRSSSPDSAPDCTFSPSKRFASATNARRLKKRANPEQSAHRRADASANRQPSFSSSSEDEQTTTNMNTNVSLHQILQELKSTQVNLQGARHENKDINEKITKLTQKINKFKTFILSKHDQDLERYRDPNDKEVYQELIMYEGRNLLEVSAKNAGDYARNLLKILFKPEELQSSLLPSQQSKRYAKQELDHTRIRLLNDAVRTRYRIPKYGYDNFYSERIQSTLAGCIYNIGRKLRKNAKETEKQTPSQEHSSVEYNPVSTSTFD